jgi:hypothetical protein
MSTKDDTAIARRFEPTDDGHFLHRAGGKEYKLTRAQAGALARRLERAQTSFLLFALFMAFNPLDFFFDLSGPGFWGIAWLSISGVAAVLAVIAALFALVDSAKAVALLKDYASGEIGKTNGPAKPWRQRFASLRTMPGARRMGTRNLVTLCVASSVWFVVSALVLSTSPSWLADSLAWLGEGVEDWFVRRELYFVLAIFFITFLVGAIFSLVTFAVSLKTLRNRFHGAETEETKI